LDRNCNAKENQAHKRQQIRLPQLKILQRQQQTPKQQRLQQNKIKIIAILYDMLTNLNHHSSFNHKKKDVKTTCSEKGFTFHFFLL